jgi:hypothetical protein
MTREQTDTPQDNLERTDMTPASQTGIVGTEKDTVTHKL